MLRQAFSLLMVSLALTHLVAADTGVPSPESAIALKDTGSNEAQIAWAPPIEGPVDYYRVYGHDGAGGKVQLAETSGYFATVAASYVRYTVVSVYQSVESAPTDATPLCIRTSLTSLPPIDIFVPCPSS